jgi:thiol-disulfide isomerase/thioredoxin
MTLQELQPRSAKAHELYGDFWFNSEPVPISALRGQVILIHFWDYTCQHCLRSLPYIAEWHRKYKSYGLVVVGVHSPKFPFGKNPESIQSAIVKHSIEYPVVADNENLIASRYANRCWPSMYLIDKDGYVRFQNTGEGSYGAVESALQRLLYDAGVREDLPDLMDPVRDADRPGAVCYRATPELFAGYLKGSIGNVEGYNPESVVSYADPSIYLAGRFYAEGNWLNDKNCLRLSGPAAPQGRIIVSYQGVEVNAVMKSEQGNVEVDVEQDGKYLTAENKGDDVVVDGTGRSMVVVNEARLYSVVKNREYGEHTLRMSTGSDGFALYSLTFVSCVIPELITNN